MTNIDECRNARDAAKAALEAAQREAAEMDGNLARLSRVLTSAAEAYDADPSDANGKTVLDAKSARELAELRAGRAGRRLGEAGETLKEAERALRRAELEGQLADARTTLEEAERAEVEGLAARNAAHIGPELARLISESLQWEKDAGEQLAAAQARRVEALAQIGAVEAELLSVAPELGEQLAAAQARRIEAERAQLAELAGVQALRAELGLSVGVVALAENLRERYQAQFEKVFAAHQATTHKAREAGADVPEVDRVQYHAHLSHLRFLALPKAKRTPEALEYFAASFAAEGMFDVKGGYRAPQSNALNYEPSRVYLGAQEFIDHCLSARSSKGIGRSWAARLHELALAAGDPRAIDEEKRRDKVARMARGETIPSTPISKEELKAREAAVAEANRALHKNLSGARAH